MSADRSPSRAAAAVVALLLVVDLVGGGLVLRADRSRPQTPRVQPVAAPTPTLSLRLPVESREDAARRMAVESLLVARSTALLSRNRDGWLATVDPQSPTFRAQQATLFDNLGPVPLSSWSYELDPSRYGPLSATAMARYGTAEVWRPDIRLRYSLTGFDTEPASDHQVLTFVHRATGWYLSGVDESVDPHDTSVTNIWDDGPVQVLTGSRTLAMAHPGHEATLRKLLTAMETAGPRVDAAWGTDWSRTVVVLLPDDGAEFSRLVGDGAYDEIAAVAKAELIGPRDDRTPVGERVLINPPNYRKLNALGRRVVLTHELTHVATRRLSDQSVPIWLVEGFADYVGYLGTDVSTLDAAGELGNDVAAGKLPDALPGQSDFLGGNPALAQAYEQSWLACRLIAQLGGAGEVGTQSLVDFYKAVDASTAPRPEDAVAAVMQERLGLTPIEFITRWQKYLKDNLK